MVVSIARTSSKLTSPKHQSHQEPSVLTSRQAKNHNNRGTGNLDSAIGSVGEILVISMPVTPRGNHIIGSGNLSIPGPVSAVIRYT